MSNNDYGLINFNNGPDSTIPNEDYNCFYNNATDDIDDDGVSTSLAANSISADPLFVDRANGDYRLQEASPCVGSDLPTWWGNEPRPVSLSGEPIPDSKIDLGAYQSTWDANHPANL